MFVATKWTPGRDDLAIELAGEIELEEMTLAEWAQAKADRLEGLADKRAEQANVFRNVARSIGERFEFGQPILAGHHSERKARKDKDQMEKNDRKAVEASKAVGYWLYRAESVERHANFKSNPRTRARRIKTLLAEFRSFQRRISDAHKKTGIWELLVTPEQITTGAASYELCNTALAEQLRKGEVTHAEVKNRMIRAFQNVIGSDNLWRWINHTLNRLSFERELLGEVARFEGEITPTLLQMFIGEDGADKPKGAEVEAGVFSVQCEAPLPAHIAAGDYVELTADAAMRL